MKMPNGNTDSGVHLVFDSDPIAVRAALVTLLASPAVCSMHENVRSTIEIVLAEVLNNIVEHAYANQPGTIHISLHPKPEGVFVVVCDQGLPFPKEVLPQGALPAIEATDSLPEGGFGWFLIRSLVQGLTYRRNAASNHLSFLLPTDATTPNVH